MAGATPRGVVRRETANPFHGFAVAIRPMSCPSEPGRSGAGFEHGLSMGPKWKKGQNCKF